jgi:outer membrane protein TolC
MIKILPTIILAVTVVVGSVQAKTVLTVDEVRSLAMDHNRQLQTARKELDRARGEVISARSGALPQLSLNGRYTRNLREQVIFFEDPESKDVVQIPITQNNDFNLALSLTQPIFNGGKAFTAWQIAKIYKKYSIEKLKEVEQNIIYSAESIFYTAIMAQSNLDVVRSAYEQLSHNLDIVEKYFNQGMVSEYELLRARVEKLNLEPQLISAESHVSLARKQLKSFLGLPLNEEIELIYDMSDTTLVGLPSLDSLTTSALQTRPEVKQAELQVKGYDKAVGIARSDWIYPRLNLNTTYTFAAASDDFKLYDEEISRSWTASVLLTIPLFDGGRTIGEVRKAKTDYYQAVLTEEQLKDDIRLEVEQAYDQINQAKRALDLQRETIQQAEEGMRIANLRYQTGVGTQLEILSAQTALTDARTNLARAVYQFRLAKSELKKVTGLEIN